MRYSMLQLDNTSHRDMSMFLANTSKVKLGNTNSSDNHKDGLWTKACPEVVQIITSIDIFFNRNNMLVHQNALDARKMIFHNHQRYL